MRKLLAKNTQFYLNKAFSIFASRMKPKTVKIKLFCLLMALCMSGFIQAQKYGVSIEAGYQKGIQTKNKNDAPYPSTKSFSLGAGVSRQLMFHVFPDSSNWFFSTGLFALSGNGVENARYLSANGRTEMHQTLSLNSLRWINKLTYGFDLGRFELQVSGGIGLPISSKLIEDTYVNDSSFSSHSTAEIKNFKSLAFMGGLGINTFVFKNFELFLNADVFLMNANVKNRKLTAYSDSRNRSLEEVYQTIASLEYEYHTDVNLIRNNQDVLPSIFNKNKATDKLSYAQSYSSIGLQFGFLYLF
jgi:hypothetical protein